MRTLQFIFILVILCGCTAPTKPVTSGEPKDQTIETLITLSEGGHLNGYWDNNGFGGEFHDLKFAPHPSQENIYRLTGSGALWTGDGLITFWIQGYSFGRRIAADLILDDKRTTWIKVGGEIGVDAEGYPTCTLVFAREGEDQDQNKVAPLLLARPEMIPTHRKRFLEGLRSADK